MRSCSENCRKNALRSPISQNHPENRNKQQYDNGRKVDRHTRQRRHFLQQAANRFQNGICDKREHVIDLIQQLAAAIMTKNESSARTTIISDRISSSE